MNKIFKFSAYDHLTPFSNLVIQASTAKSLEELSNFPLSVIKKAKVNLLSLEKLVSVKEIRTATILGLPIDISDLNYNYQYKELIKHKDYKDKLQHEINQRLPSMNDEEIATVSNVYKSPIKMPLKFSIISSFEDLWHIFLWKRDEKLSEKEIQ